MTLLLTMLGHCTAVTDRCSGHLTCGIFYRRLIGLPGREQANFQANNVAACELRDAVTNGTPSLVVGEILNRSVRAWDVITPPRA
jgi:hypothetical protein